MKSGFLREQILKPFVARPAVISARRAFVPAAMRAVLHALLIIAGLCAAPGAAVSTAPAPSSAPVLSSPLVPSLAPAPVTGLSSPLAPSPAAPLPTNVRFDKLVIEKSARRLTAWSGGECLREYRVALGPAPEGPKRVQGDGKTPEGLYYVDGKNPHSRFYKNLGVSYPDKNDRKNAAALGRSPGGDIKIHGLGPEFRHLGVHQWQYDWTLGCIAVTDEEIDELYKHTNVGAVIEILP